MAHQRFERRKDEETRLFVSELYEYYNYAFNGGRDQSPEAMAADELLEVAAAMGVTDKQLGRRKSENAFVQGLLAHFNGAVALSYVGGRQIAHLRAA